MKFHTASQQCSNPLGVIAAAFQELGGVEVVSENNLAVEMVACFGF